MSLEIPSSLFDTDPEAFAKRLTHIEADLFKKVTPTELVRRVVHSQIPTGDADNTTPIVDLGGKVNKVISIQALCGFLTTLDILDHIMGGRTCLGIRGRQGGREGPEVPYYCCECRFLPSCMGIICRVNPNQMRSTAICYTTSRAWFLSSAV